jgi:hypothetical protein
MHTRKSALEAMQHSSRILLAEVGGVADAQWQLRPADQEWSIAETVEHVVLANRGILARLRGLLAAPLARDAVRFDDAAISNEMFRGPGPPGFAEPTSRFATCAEGVGALRASCDAIAAWAEAVPEPDLRSHGLPHPVFGVFDGVQWILFSAAHMDNHLPQLRALRSHAEIVK